MAFDAGTIETTLTIDRSPFKAGLIEARKEAEAFEKRGIKLKVDVDKSFTGQIQRAINETQAKTGRGIRIPVTIDDKVVQDVQEQLDRIGDNTEKTANRSGNRFARALLNPLILQLGLIPGIAQVAAAGGALALGILPLAMGAIGIAALKSNERIKSSYAGLWEDIKADAEEFAEPMIDTFLRVSNEIRGTWDELGPDLRAMFADAGPLVEEFVNGVLGAAEEAVPRFRTAIQLSGPAMRGFSSLIRDVGAGVGEMTVEIANSSVDVGRSTQLAGQFLRGLLQDVGQLVAVFSGFWADIGPRFNNVFNQFMDAVVQFTDGGLRGLDNGLNVTLGILQALLDVIGPFAAIFGQMGGTLLGLAGSWKLLAGTVGLFVAMIGKLRPSEWATKMSGFSNAVANASNTMGGWVTKATGSAAAGDRFAGAASKIGSAVTTSISWLPVLGTAIVGVQAAVDHFWPSADTLAEKIQQGGKAAEEARGQMIDYGNNINTANLWATAFAETSDEVKAAIDRQRAGMTELERAQADAAKAQRDYDYAVDKFGPTSEQARSAQISLAGAVDDVEHAQGKAAEATKSHTDKIIEQTNLMLGAVGAQLNYQSSLLQLEQAQRGLADAVAQHGAGSLEARQADIQYQQQLLSTIQAIGARVTAENAHKGAVEASELANAAMRMEIARLAVAAGENLPPALAEMASKLSDAELAALGVTKEVDGTGQAIYRLPPGKELKFPNNAGAATGGVNGLRAAIDSIPPVKYLTFLLTYETQGAPPRNSAPPPGAPDTPGLFGGGRAEGGPVRRGVGYWVGDDSANRPELFFPDVDGFVLNGRDSAKLATSVRSGGRPAQAMELPAGESGTAEFDYVLMAQAFAQVLDGAKLVVDGEGLAKIVNQTNIRNAAR